MAIVKLSGNIGESLEEALHIIGGLNLRSLPIYIQPNLCADTDREGGANINGGFIRSVIDLVLKRNSDASVEIIESDSTDKYADKAFENMGYTEEGGDSQSPSPPQKLSMNLKLAS